MSPVSLAINRETSVDFPEPEGAEMIKTVVIDTGVDRIVANIYRNFSRPEQYIHQP